MNPSMKNFRQMSTSQYFFNKSSRNEKDDVENTIISFKDLRSQVLEELKNKEKIAGVKWKRFPSLNKILKGHRKGELTVLTGNTGSGKTTFLSEYSLDLCSQGVRTLWGNFELQNVRFAKMMLNQLAQKQLANNLNLFDDYADEFEKLPLHFMKFHGAQNLKKVLQTMNYAINEFEVHHIIIDNLQFMLGNLVTIDRFAYQDAVVGSCRSFATENNIHVTIVIHPRKELTEELSINSFFGGGKATQEADNVLILQKSTSGGINCKKFLQVCKNRYDGQLGTFPLYYKQETQGFGINLNENDSRSLNERKAALME